MVCVQDFYEFSLDLEDLVLPSIEKDSQGPGQVVMPKRKSLLQKKMAAKSADMVQQIAGGSKTGGMGAMSFGGQGQGQGSEEKGPVRAAGVCPVAHTPAAIGAYNVPSADSTTRDRDRDRAADHHSDSDSDSNSEPMMSSQPFLEKKPDALPEIQARRDSDMV